LTDTPAGLANVVSIFSGRDFFMAQQGDGNIVVWGDSTFGQTTVPAGLNNVAAYAAAPAGRFALALRDASHDTSPAISQQPAEQSASAGQTANFSVTATGGFLTYQWQKDGVAILRATASTLSLRNVQTADQGSYTVVVTTGAGSTTSQPATLTVPLPFNAWRDINFNQLSDNTDPLVSGPDVVLGPGTPTNLLKYALGVAPHAELPASAQAIVAQSGADWAFTYQRPADRVDATYAVEVSTDLQTWTNSGVIHQRTSSAAGVETWMGSYTTGAPRLFFRLHVTQP
jgi:hypothetical protein